MIDSIKSQYGAIKMALEITNENLFNLTVSGAIQNAIANCATENLAKRWERAIDRAVTEIKENPYVHYDDDEKHLVVLSSTSNNLYSANGVCQCLAFLNGTPCWHRAAARIWRLYLEAENKPLPPKAAAAAATVQEMSATPYFPQTSTKTVKRQKIGGVWV